jgi:hypothetical protein
MRVKCYNVVGCKSPESRMILLDLGIIIHSDGNMDEFVHTDVTKGLKTQSDQVLVISLESHYIPNRDNLRKKYSEVFCTIYNLESKHQMAQQSSITFKVQPKNDIDCVMELDNAVSLADDHMYFDIKSLNYHVDSDDILNLCGMEFDIIKELSNTTVKEKVSRLEIYHTISSKCSPSVQCIPLLHHIAITKARLNVNKSFSHLKVHTKYPNYHKKFILLYTSG